MNEIPYSLELFSLVGIKDLYIKPNINKRYVLLKDRYKIIKVYDTATFMVEDEDNDRFVLNKETGTSPGGWQLIYYAEDNTL